MFDMFISAFSSACSMEALVANFIGVALGIVFGALPGLTAVMGVALLVAYWTGTLTPLLWYMLICLPIYIGGWFFVGRRFLLYTAYGTLCTTVFGMFITFQIPLSTEVYAAVVGGVLHGAAGGIMLRTLGSGGGTDIVAVLLKERWNIPIGQFNFIFNVLLFLTGAFRLSLDLIVASMLMMFISSNALEYVLGMFNRRKLVMIISDHGEEISLSLIHI